MKRKLLITALIGFLGLGNASVALSQTAPGYTQTRYPIVLSHGLLGFDAIGPIQYFFGVTRALESGGARVFTSQVSAANSSEVRGEQLLAELRRLKAAHGYTKFNLIGHSHGGQSVRYVAAVAPELVASVTTLASPHKGSRVADIILAGANITGTVPEVSGVVNSLASLISTLSGAPALPQNSLAAARSLSSLGSTAFNLRFPAGRPLLPCGSGPAVVAGIRYYSATGTATVTNRFDPDSVLGITARVFGSEANDGLVSRCSSHWGTVLRDDYPWNHMDIVNQSFGLRGSLSPDPLAFYRTHANRLKLAGL